MFITIFASTHTRVYLDHRRYTYYRAAKTCMTSHLSLVVSERAHAGVAVVAAEDEVHLRLSAGVLLGTCLHRQLVVIGVRRQVVGQRLRAPLQVQTHTTGCRPAPARSITCRDTHGRLSASACALHYT